MLSPNFVAIDNFETSIMPPETRKRTFPKKVIGKPGKYTIRSTKLFKKSIEHLPPLELMPSHKPRPLTPEVESNNARMSSNSPETCYPDGYGLSPVDRSPSPELRTDYNKTKRQARAETKAFNRLERKNNTKKPIHKREELPLNSDVDTDDLPENDMFDSDGDPLFNPTPLFLLNHDLDDEYNCTGGVEQPCTNEEKKKEKEVQKKEKASPSSRQKLPKKNKLEKKKMQEENDDDEEQKPTIQKAPKKVKKGKKKVLKQEDEEDEGPLVLPSISKPATMKKKNGGENKMEKKSKKMVSEEKGELARKKRKAEEDHIEDEEPMEEVEEGDGDVEEEDDGEEEEQVTQTDLENFRQEMASLPLSKVREMKEKLGLKLFNDAFFGKQTPKNEVTLEEGQKGAKRVFKRENSKRPREESSKKRPSKYRPVYVIPKSNKFDPRFEEQCGEFDEQIYEGNYGFLDELREDEKKKMKKEILKAKKDGDGERVEELRQEVRRMENRERSKREKTIRQETMRELKKDNIERMKQGIKPVFVKRSEVKMKMMEKKFDQLKGDKQLDKYLRRKAKQGMRIEREGPTLGI